jgi:hypothetical protein
MILGKIKDEKISMTILDWQNHNEKQESDQFCRPTMVFYQ